MPNSFHIDNTFFNQPLDFGSIFLYQIGRLHCNPSTIVDTHTHQNIYELTVVAGGVGYVTTNGFTTTIQTGDIFINFPYDTHKIVSDDKSPLKYDFIAFNTSDERLKSDLERIQQEFTNPQWRTFKNEKVNQLLNNCIYEFSKVKEYHRDIVSHSLSLILMYVCRAFLHKGDMDKRMVTEKEKLCFQIMHYIDTHLYSIKSLKSIADEFHYTYSYLTTLFKSILNISLSEYYESKRFNLCKQLLTEDNAKIYEVAEIMGYSTPYAFSKAYKNYFNISPKQHQLNYRKENPLPKKEANKSSKAKMKTW